MNTSAYVPASHSEHCSNLGSSARQRWLGACAALVLAVPFWALAATVEPDANPAAVVSRGYIALLQTSIVPADPQSIATAALESLGHAAAETRPPLPLGFGSHAENDAHWLGTHATDTDSAWKMVRAMARSTGIAHVGLSSPQMKQGAMAFFSGRPLAAPGLSVHRLADGRFVVSEVVKGASADAAGLRLGDVVVRLGDERLVRQAALLQPVVAMPAGTTMPVEIERDGQRLRLQLELMQADVSSVESRMLAGDLAYVRFRWFAQSEDPKRDTVKLARRAFQELLARGARGLIIDLRSALGGTGDVGVASALADGDIVYLIQQPLSDPAEPIKRAGDRVWAGHPIVILINEQTISAGEALALALRELVDAKTVGLTSAGGLTEGEFVALGGGYALLIPTGVVLGPISGKDQPGHAIKPDLEVPNPTIKELKSGEDRQLDAGQKLLEARIRETRP